MRGFSFIYFWNYMTPELNLKALIEENPLLKRNGEFFRDLFVYLKTPIETGSAAALREEISKAYVFMPLLIKIKATSEALYRISQKDSASRANLKGTGRDAEINGSTAHYRYARDYTEGMLDTLNSRLSASKAILSSLNEEMKNHE